MESLSTTNGRQDARQVCNTKLMRRSCIAIGVTLLVIGVIGLIPQRQRHSNSTLDPAIQKARADYARAARPPERNSDDEEHILRHVIQLNRHGARSTIAWYGFEGDWHWANDDVAQGKLTTRGMQQAYHLGRHLCFRYCNSTGLDAVPPKAVNVYSTDVDRTVDTAHELVLGMFNGNLGDAAAERPPRQCGCRPAHGTRAAPECIQKCLQLQAELPAGVPKVQVIPYKDDLAMRQASNCVGWNRWLRKLAGTEKYKHAAQKQFAQAAKLADEVAGGSDVQERRWPSDECTKCLHRGSPNFNDVNFLESLWSNAECFTADRFTYSEVMPNAPLLARLKPAAQFVWHQQYQEKNARYTGGILLEEWMQLLEGTQLNTTACGLQGMPCDGYVPPMDIYSAHDSTVFSMLAVLRASQGAHLAHFASSLRLELWAVNADPEAGQHGRAEMTVHMFYDDTPLDTELCPKGVCTWKMFTHMVLTHRVMKDECERTSDAVAEGVGGPGVTVGCCDDAA